MSLAERLSEYVRACFTGLWVRTHEADDALHEIARLCRQERWALATWDVDRGLALAGQAAEATAIPTAADPLAAIRAPGALASPDGTALLVLRSFHRFLGSAEVVQALDTQIGAGKQTLTFVVILAPVVQGSPSSWRSRWWCWSTTCRPATSSRRSPARSPPSRASCPR